MRTGQQQIERDELLLREQHGGGEDDPTAASAARIIGVEGENDAHRFRALSAAFEMPIEDTTGQGEQIAAVDPVEAQGGGGVSTSPADLERGTARSAAEADGTLRLGRGKCRGAAPIQR